MNHKIERGRASYKKGLWAERWASLFLQCKGYHLLERRYKTPFGEIDLITETWTHVVFIEVKTRATFDEAAYAVTLKQQGRLRQAALFYMQKNPFEKPCRFDVLLVKKGFFPIHLKNVLWSET